MKDYAKILEFMELEQEYVRRSMEAAKNSFFPFILTFPEQRPIDYSWQPLLFTPEPPKHGELDPAEG